MEYLIKNEVKLEKDDIVRTMTEMDLDGTLLRQGAVLKVVTAKVNYIELIVLFNPGDCSSERAMIQLFRASPAEDFEFFGFLENFEYANTQNLEELNIPFEWWPKKHLINYIHFLMDNMR